MKSGNRRNVAKCNEKREAILAPPDVYMNIWRSRDLY